MKCRTLFWFITSWTVTATANNFEQTETILSAVARKQGYKCLEPIEAIKNPADSIPEEMAWLLRCNNATYKIQLFPHSQSKIKVLK